MSDRNESRTLSDIIGPGNGRRTFEELEQQIIAYFVEQVEAVRKLDPNINGYTLERILAKIREGKKDTRRKGDLDASEFASNGGCGDG